MTEKQMPQETSAIANANQQSETKQWHAPLVRCFEESEAEFGGGSGQDALAGS